MSKISIIIPIYNVEKYIARCAQSLFEQTLNDIEYIFVNDCTKDNSMVILFDIINKYPNRKNQIKIINHECNKGLPEARKSGILSATGDYIAHCDSDDWVDINMYKELYTKAKENDYDMVFCDFYHTDGNYHMPYNRRIAKELKSDILSFFLKEGVWCVWGGIVNSKLYKNKIHFPKENSGEDLALTLQLIYYSNKFAYIEKPLYYYFHNPTSITNEIGLQNLIKRNKQLYININIGLDFLKSNNLDIKYKDEILILKLRCRELLSPYSHHKEIYSLWNDTFPELNNISLILGSRINIKFKIKYIATKTKTYYFLKSINRILKL